MSTFRFYLDLRCPFCFVQGQRLASWITAQDSSVQITPQTVRHERPLPLPARAPTQDERQNLLAYFERIASVDARPGRAQLQVPPIWPNTGPASLAIAAAIRLAPALASRFAALLLEALWIDGRDVSSTMVINLVAHEAGIKKLTTTAEDEVTLRGWTAMWDARPPEWRTPVLQSPRGAVMVGLGDPERLDAFLRAGRLNSLDGSAC